MLQANITLGQETDFVYGTLINADDQTPIPFVHITIKNKAKGTISNMDGGFRIPKNYYDTRDTLVISSIGYSSKTIPLLSLEQDLRNEIFLIRKEEVLDEITLKEGQTTDYSGSLRKKKLRVEDIIQLAIDQIPKNYPYEPFSYVGYYRDYQMKKTNYINLNEAVMQVFDAGFGASDSVQTQTRIYSYEKNATFREDTISARPYDYTNRMKFVTHTELDNPKAARNEFTFLRIHDALRNHNINTYDFVNRLDVHFINNHKFKLLPDTSIDGISLYAINIYKRAEYFTVIGKIFISKGDFKIYKMQYAIYNKSEPLESKKERETYAKESIRYDRKFGKLLYEIIVEYQLFNGMMYPNYISFNNSFISKQPSAFFPIELEITDTNLITLTFDRNPRQKYAMKKNNYRLVYNFEPLKIDRIEINNNKVLLYLNKNTPIEVVYRYQPIDIENYNQLTIHYKDIYKFYNWEFNRNLDRGYNAYREFNINEIKKLDVLATRVYDINEVIKLDTLSFKEDAIILNLYRSYNQYREFFVQELDMYAAKPTDTLYMIKTQPIFKNQPIAPKENLQEYWMNTPLKN